MNESSLKFNGHTRDLNIFERFVLSMLKFGKIPNHLAVIMDGNRRYAKFNQIPTKEGHRHGSLKLFDLLKWSCALGIEIITVYAFSLENFKRDQQEVCDLFDLFLDRLNLVLQKIDECKQNRHVNDKSVLQGYRVRFCGDQDRLPAELRYKIKKLEDNIYSTESIDGSDMLLNICICYTSTNDIFRGIDKLRRESQSDDNLILQKLNLNMVSLLSADFSDIANPDIILRTGGNARLSEFLVFQSAFSLLSFIETTWPQLTLFEFLCAILNYQLHYPFIKQASEIEKVHFRHNELFNPA
ncbi:hypothetical protein GJ496_009744 [Pomphorhynchus laevis]|nr:hypothetical protein GJ496_009744 [Pomphorhynchus laevis]